MATQISAQELYNLYKDTKTRKTVYILDVSSRDTFAEEHIAYALNSPLDEIENKKESALPKERLLVCYAHEPAEAEKAAALYEKMGYHVKLLTDGINAWKAADYPVAG